MQEIPSNSARNRYYAVLKYCEYDLYSMRKNNGFFCKTACSGVVDTYLFYSLRSMCSLNNSNSSMGFIVTIFEVCLLNVRWSVAVQLLHFFLKYVYINETLLTIWPCIVSSVYTLKKEILSYWCLEVIWMFL